MNTAKEELQSSGIRISPLSQQGEDIIQLMEHYSSRKAKEFTVPYINALKEIKRPINSTILMLMAHPDNETDSEFADRIDDLQEVLREIETVTLGTL